MDIFRVKREVKIQAHRMNNTKTSNVVEQLLRQWDFKRTKRTVVAAFGIQVTKIKALSMVPKESPALCI